MIFANGLIIQFTWWQKALVNMLFYIALPFILIGICLKNMYKNVKTG